MEDKQEALRICTELLDLIQAQGREPDDWEGQDVAAALGAIHCGWNKLAITYADRACTHPDERSGRWPRNDDTPSLAMLRAGIEYARQVHGLKG